MPGEALTTGPSIESKQWRERFDAEVIADAQARGLSREAIGSRAFAVLAGGVRDTRGMHVGGLGDRAGARRRRCGRGVCSAGSTRGTLSARPRRAWRRPRVGSACGRSWR